MDTPNETPGNLTLLVLAAGMGSRYGGIKQIDGFGPSGETIMDYSLFDAVRAGFTKVVFIVREEIEQIVRERFGPSLEGKVEVAYVIQSLDKLVAPEFQNPERTKPWGTGHAVLCAAGELTSPFVAINADDYYGFQAFNSIATFFREDKAHTHAMVGYTLDNVLSDHGSVSRGVGETDPEGYLTTIVERTVIVREKNQIIAREKEGDLVLSPTAPTSMNFWGFRPEILPQAMEMFHDFLQTNSGNLKSEFYIPLIVNKTIQSGAGKFKVLGGGVEWFGVTYKEDKDAVSARLHQLVADGIYPSPLW